MKKSKLILKRYPLIALAAIAATFITTYLIMWFQYGAYDLKFLLSRNDPSFTEILRTMGIIIGVAGFVEATLRTKQATYNEVNEQYKTFVETLASEKEESKIIGFSIADLDRFRQSGGDRKSLLIYDQLFSMCEYAFALYGSNEKSWRRWEDWLGNFFDNDPLAYLAWEITSPYYEDPFRQRITTNLIGDRSGRLFPKKEEWANATPLNDTLSIIRSNNNEATLKIYSFQVMQAWEDNLMRQMANLIPANCKSVLEIGYGLGISTGYIQQRAPNKHVILEPNRFLAKEASEKYKDQIQKGHVEIIEMFWEDKCPDFISGDKKFHAIFFDGYPLAASEIRRNHINFFKTASKLLIKGGLFTFFSDHSRYISPTTQKLIFDNFPNSSIKCKQIPVEPYQNCEYWTDDSILMVSVEA